MRSKANKKGAAVARRAVFCEELEPRTLFAALPAGFAETQLVSGLLSPTAMTVAPDGRVFITSQDGTVRIVQNGKLLPTPFLSITSSYGQASQGIMGIALDPNFESNGYVYIDYTVGGSTSVQRISRFTANGNVAVPGSEDVLFQVGPQTSYGHVGGGLTFGADGDLYFSYGDDNLGNMATLAPELNNFYGKILRIEPDGTIPTDNPFYNQTTGDYRAIWAYGIRNAFKISEQSTTGLIYIADVGEGTYEDIFQGEAGANYGWPTTEGPTTLPGITPPVYSYPHTGSSTGSYSITGGFFYNPTTDQFPSQYVGEYVFADWGTGLIQAINPANPSTATTFATGAYDIVGLDDAPDGSFYYLTRGDENYGLQSPDGQLFQVQYTGSQAPSIDTQPANATAAVGSTAIFSVAANGTGPFTYQWQENNSNIPGANSSTYTTGALAAIDNGDTFDVIVTNAVNSATSAAAVLSIIPHPAPTVSLTAPAVSSFFTAGQALAYSATATEPAAGALPASDYSWNVQLYHDNTITTVQSAAGITSGSYLVPTTPLNDADAFYRVTLTVTDSAGLSTTAFQNVIPNDCYITVTSSVPGAELTVDGAAVTTPDTFMSIAGTIHTIAAASSQIIAGTTYQFRSWSDSGTASHTITTPVTTTSNNIAPIDTFTANYSVLTKTTPAITWTTPAAIAYGTALSAAQLDAAADVPGVFAYNPLLGAVLSAGTQALAVTFTPTDTTDYNTATASVNLVVNKATTTTVVTSSGSPASVGQSITFTATIAPTTGGGETGTVQFQIDGANVGSPVALTGNTATYVTSSLAAGSHSVLAVYSGDGNFAASTSAAFSQSINPVSSATSGNYDFGTATSPVASGYTQVTSATVFTNALGYGWLAGAYPISGYDTGITTSYAGVPTALTRDFNYTMSGIFQAAVADGTYNVTLVLGDARAYSYSQSVAFDGTTVGTVTTGSASAVVSKTYAVTVTNGLLEVGLTSTSSKNYAVLDGLSFVPATTPFAVVSSTPAAGSTVSAAVSQMTVMFNQPVGAGAAVAGNYTVTGASAVSVTSASVSNQTVTLTFASPITTAGAYTLTIGAGVDDAAGSSLGAANTIGFTYAAATASPLEYDFGTATSPVAAGWTQVANATAFSNTLGYGWTSTSAALAYDTGITKYTTPDPNVTRDFDYTHGDTFAVNLADGTYTVTLVLGDARDYSYNMNVSLEGAAANNVITTTAQPIVSKVYTVTVVNNQLTVNISSSSSSWAVIDGLSIVAG